MWRAIGLIGRDKLLKKEIHPRITKGKPFFLTGKRGTGKTAILEWAHHSLQEGRKAYVSAQLPPKELLVFIVEQWGLEIEVEGKKISPQKVTSTVLDKAIAKENKGIIFIDDIHKASPTLIRRLRLWKERFCLYIAGTPPYREELKQVLWGLKEYEIHPIPKDQRTRLAQRMCEHYEALISFHEVAQASRGIPGRMAAMAMAGEVEDTSHRVEGEELDLSPVLLLGIVAIVAVRYIGMGLNETDIYVLGGIGAGFTLFLRYFLFKGMAK